MKAIGGATVGSLLATVTFMMRANRLLGEGPTVGLLVVAVAGGVLIWQIDRVTEFAAGKGGLRVLLAKVDQAKRDLEQVRGELRQLYGNIDHIARSPLVLDRETRAERGLEPGHLALADSVMRNVAGVTKRERERLARVFVAANQEAVARATLDGSLDRKVFKWKGPESPSYEEPTPVVPVAMTRLSGSGDSRARQARDQQQLPSRLSAQPPASAFPSARGPVGHHSGRRGRGHERTRPRLSCFPRCLLRPNHSTSLASALRGGVVVGLHRSCPGRGFFSFPDPPHAARLRSAVPDRGPVLAIMLAALVVALGAVVVGMFRRR